MAHHAHHRLLVEESYRCGSQLGYIDECIGVRILVDQRISDVQRALRRIDDVHSTEVLELRTNADDFFDNLYSIRILRIQASNESIGLTCLDHHHTKVIALEHLVIGLLESVTFTLALLGQDTCIALTALLLARMA